MNWAYVSIEGPPLFVRTVEIADAQVVVALSDGTAERLDPGTLRQGEDGALYCSARGGKLAARFTPDAAQRLAPVVAEDDDGVYLDIEGARVRPPTIVSPSLIAPIRRMSTRTDA